MHGDDTIALHRGEPVPRGMETFFSAGHDFVFDQEAVPDAQRFPDRDLRLGQHHDDRHGRIEGMERFDGPTQQRLPLHQHELLGDGATHALAGAACYDDGGTLHGMSLSQRSEGAVNKCPTKKEAQSYSSLRLSVSAAFLPQMINIASP